ncbi:MAG: trigger factor [Chloroflexi bacterium]|nr:trigger factor [Chloroflexota bacterium]
MKVSTEQAERRQVVLNVEMEPAETEKALESAYRRLVQKYTIPGFRKGKTPRNILERYVGKGALLEDAIEHMVPDAYRRAIIEQKIDPVAQPKLELVSAEPVRFKAIVPLRPEVKITDYKQIRVEPETIQVTEEQVESTLDHLRQQHAVWAPVDRPVKFGDMVTADIQSSAADKQLLNEKDAPFRVEKDAKGPLPGFAEKLEGMVKSEEREFDLPFPDDYPSEEYKGKTAHFKVKVNEIKEQNLPALDDAFAKGIGAGVDTVEALREKVRTELKARAEAAEQSRFQEKSIQALADRTQAEYPPVMLEAEIDRLTKRFEEGLTRSGQKMSDYLKAANKTVGQIREEFRPAAKKGLVRSLALWQLSKEENLQVVPEELSGQVEKMSKDAGEKSAQLKKLLEMPDVLESLENEMLTQKTIARLVEIAKGNSEAETTAAPAAHQAEQPGEAK